MSVKGTITVSDYLPFEEYQRLISNLEEDKKYKWAIYCLMSFCLALRISDILRLKWKHILDHKGIVVTERKTGKTKYVPIGSKTSEHIHKLYEMSGKPSMESYIFPNKYGKPMSRQYVNKELKNWKGKYSLKLGNFSSHTFRKTFGRYVYNKMGKTQESLVYLNRVFRHSSIATTMIYLGIRDEEISGIFEGINV